MGETKDNNAKLAYEYTKLIWETTTSSYDTVTTKLTTALGFSGLLLRFAADLSSDKWLIFLKLGVCFALSMSILSCCIGLWPKSSGGNLVPPDDFIDEEKGTWFSEDESLSYLYISRGLNKETKQINKNRSFRLKWLNIAVISIGIASIGFAVSIGSNSGISETTGDSQETVPIEIASDVSEQPAQQFEKTEPKLTGLPAQL